MPKSEGPRVEIRDLVKEFRRRGSKERIVPVNHANLTLHSGETVVLLGPSGCGKTTLLRCVAGLERPDTGRLTVGGTPVFDSDQGIFVPANERRLSMIFQSYALWPHMTVAENVGYPLSIRRDGTRDQRQRRVSGILDMVGLHGLEDQYPGQISGGQQQRVALARALIADPQTVLFDEPLSNVDAKVRGQLRDELKAMQREIGFASLYVTHDQAEAMHMADRIAVLNNGVIEQIDTPEVLYHRPATDYVADFIGSANLLHGTVVTHGTDGTSVDTNIGPICAEAGQDLQVTKDDRVGVVVRPERAQLRSEPNGHRNTWTGTVRTRSFAGTHTEYLIDHDGDLLEVWSPDGSHAEGDAVAVHFPPDAVRLVALTGRGAGA